MLEMAGVIYRSLEGAQPIHATAGSQTSCVNTIYLDRASVRRGRGFARFLRRSSMPSKIA
jgi:hypothetical protein